MEPFLGLNPLKTMNGIIIEGHNPPTEQFHVGIRWFALNLNFHNTLSVAADQAVALWQLQTEMRRK